MAAVSTSQHPSAPPRRLPALLASLFTQQELRGVVSGIPGGVEILNGIAARPSKTEFIDEVIDALDRRGLLAQLFSSLRTQRPGRLDDIVRVEHLVTGETTATGQLREAAVRALAPQSVQPYSGSEAINTLVTWAPGRLLLLWPIIAEEADRVALDDLRLALTSELPVLLVTGGAECTAWRWADASLVGALAEAQDFAVSVPFPTPESDIRAFVERTIATFERPRWRWEPEAWGRLQTRAAELGRGVRELSREADATAALQALEAASSGIEDARFVVTVAGPFRAGKSTLINALLERAVSPVSRRPTTAVTVEFEAGPTPLAEVYFGDGTRKTGEASPEFLAEFATQDANRNNQRNVRFIRVRVPSPLLSQGVVLLDAPGLQDPNEAMLRIADEAIRRAHAVLYVVDGAPFHSGGFVLNREIIEDIRRIGTRAGRRIILLVNKIDVLSEEQRHELAEMLREQLAAADITEHILGEPRFISAERGWLRASGRGLDDGGLALARRSLWEELLRHGEVGFHQLRDAVRSLEQATGDLMTLIAARRIRGSETERLRSWLASADNRVARLHDELRSTGRELGESARIELTSARQDITREISRWIRSFPLDRSLPSPAEVTDELRNRFMGAAYRAWEHAAAGLAAAEARVTEIIEAELRQARMIVAFARRGEGLAAPDIKIRFQTDDGVKQGVQRGLLVTFFSALVGATPFGVLASGVLTALASILSSRSERRAADVARLEKEIGGKADEVQRTLTSQICAQIQTYLSDVTHRVNDRLGVFVSAINERIGEIGAAPVTAEEAKRLMAQERRACELRKEISALVDEIFRVGMELGENRPPKSSSADTNDPTPAAKQTS